MVDDSLRTGQCRALFLSQLLLVSILSFSPLVVVADSSDAVVELEMGVHIATSIDEIEFSITASSLEINTAYTLIWELYENDSSSYHVVESGGTTWTSSQIYSILNYSVSQFYTGELHYELVVKLLENSAQVDSDSAGLTVFRNTIAPQFTSSFVFGDSLSDMGNTNSSIIGLPNSPPYYDGRFSNGPNWVEGVADYLGHSLVHGYGSAAGENRAFGGAQTGQGYTYILIPNVGTQINNFQANVQSTFNASDLVMFWAGGNDFLFGVADSNATATNMASHLTQLAGMGAKTILLPNLPPLEKTPEGLSRSSQEQASLANKIVYYNQLLAQIANNLSTSLNINIIYIDAYTMFDEITTNKSFYGLVNVNSPACQPTGLGLVPVCDAGDYIVPNVDEYMFFDKVHPTLMVHSVISNIGKEVLGIPDTDGDSVNDSADICAWTSLSESADAEGCSWTQRDDDSDGVDNANDVCPNTPSAEIADANGCSLSQLDTDGDGVSDLLDICPNTPLGEAVNATGCAWSERDDDLDGVLNGEDDCPDTLSGWSVDSSGCAQNQRDDDQDSVTNDLDLCPNTWAGSSVDADGCALYQKDSDSDGVYDHLDECPQTPQNDIVDSSGCGETQKDGDNDGVMNAGDACPSTPEGLDVNAVGCADIELDTDHDGYSDANDTCPDTDYGIEVDTDGCSDYQKDGDGDGTSDAEDLCPSVDGNNSGCPDLSILIASPVHGSTSKIGTTVEVEVALACSSDCSMDFSMVLRGSGDILVASQGLNTGTHLFTLTYDGVKIMNIDIGVYSGEMENSSFLTILWVEPEDGGGGGDDGSNESGNFSSDEPGVVIPENAMIVILLIAILTFLLLLRSQQDNPPPKVSDEVLWSEQTTLVDTVPTENTSLESQAATILVDDDLIALLEGGDSND